MNWKTEIALARELIDETEVLLRAEGGFSMDLAHRKALHAIERARFEAEQVWQEEARRAAH